VRFNDALTASTGWPRRRDELTLTGIQEEQGAATAIDRISSRIGICIFLQEFFYFS
jgi:hypothetical protein